MVEKGTKYKSYKQISKNLLREDYNLTGKCL